MPPSDICGYLAKFEATFVTDNNWSGHGCLSYGKQKNENAPITKRG